MMNIRDMIAMTIDESKLEEALQNLIQKSIDYDTLAVEVLYIIADEEPSKLIADVALENFLPF